MCIHSITIIMIIITIISLGRHQTAEGQRPALRSGGAAMKAASVSAGLAAAALAEMSRQTRSAEDATCRLKCTCQCQCGETKHPPFRTEQAGQRTAKKGREREREEREREERGRERERDDRARRHEGAEGAAAPPVFARLCIKKKVRNTRQRGAADAGSRARRVQTYIRASTETGCIVVYIVIVLLLHT